MYKTMQFKCADQFNETAGAVGTNNSIAPTTMGKHCSCSGLETYKSCPPNRSVQILTLGACECDLV